MTLEPLLVFELALLGMCTGFLAGLLGIGGGMLMVPFMTFILSAKGFPAEYTVKMAVATSLSTICFTSLSSVRAHHQRGAVLWPVVRLLAPGILVGSLLGAQVAVALSGKFLSILFALFVGFSATQMFLDRKPKPARTLPGGWGMFGVGSLIGVLSSLVGAAWEPTKPVEFVVPAGTGGGADQMARFIQGVVTKHKLMKQPIVVVNKSGGAGAEGFLEVKGAKGNPHKIIITLSNLFTTPLATGVPFNWRDLTPVAMLALDEFVLWVNAESPHKTAKDYLAAIKAGADRQQVQDGRHRLQAGRPDHHRADREGRRQEDHLRALQGRRRRGRATGRQARRLDGEQPDRGRGALALGQAARPVRDGQGPPCPTRQGHRHQSWADIPTCKSAGIDAEYLMLRGIFMPRARRRTRSPSTSTCSRRCASCRSGRSSWRRAPSTRPS
jgi:putative tricarboxylic transport membrane protein